MQPWQGLGLAQSSYDRLGSDSRDVIGSAVAAVLDMREVLQWFEAIDKDRDGQLSAVELQSALQLGGLNFSLATVAHIIR